MLLLSINLTRQSVILETRAQIHYIFPIARKVTSSDFQKKISHLYLIFLMDGFLSSSVDFGGESPSFLEPLEPFDLEDGLFRG